MKKITDNQNLDTTSFDEEEYTPVGESQSLAQTTKEAPTDDIVSLAKQLIVVPSVTGDIENAVKVLELAKQQLSDHEFTPYVSNSYPSLLYRNQNTNNFKIILNAHLDVVAGSPEQYIPEVKDGKLIGRGAYDMKGAAAVMILLFNELADKVDYPLGLQLVTEEEIAGGDGTDYQLQNGVRTEFAIMGECGSNFRIIHETKGIITAHITVNGTAAHGAYPWKGQNAILKMYEVLRKIQEHFPHPTDETDGTTVTVSKIHTTNPTWNRVPDHCSAVFDIRFNKKDRDTILKDIKAMLPEDVEFEISQMRNAHFSDPNSGYMQTLKEVGSDVLGRELPIEKTHGGSDTTFFSNVGCDAVEFGPTGHGQHNSDEWVDIQALADYYQILKKFLMSIK